MTVKTGKDLAEHLADSQNLTKTLAKEIVKETIDQILKSQGFAPLPKRTHQERTAIRIPAKIKPPESVPLEIQNLRIFNGNECSYIDIL